MINKLLIYISDTHRYQKIAEASGAAEGIKLIGNAEASRIENVGNAEAEYLRLRAEAFKRYGHAAISSLIVKKLPQVGNQGYVFLGSCR